MNKKLQGSISISRFSNYREDDDKCIQITITDESSGSRFLEIRMTPRDLANALTGLSDMEVEFELHSDYVGTKREVKREKIPVPRFDVSEREVKELLLGYEVSGWMAHTEDFKNHHRHSRVDDQHYFDVGFTRYVVNP